MSRGLGDVYKRQVPFYWDRGDGVFDRKNLQVYDELEYNGLMEGIK